jgi:hypothetical protein
MFWHTSKKLPIDFQLNVMRRNGDAIKYKSRIPKTFLQKNLIETQKSFLEVINGCKNQLCSNQPESRP